MSLKNIVKMAPPPRNPIHPGTATSWLEVQHHFRGVLPACLDEYGRTYGSGYFESNDEFGLTLTIYNPHDPAYASNVEYDCQIYAGLQADSPEFYPYSCFPEKDGLFPLGVTGGSTPCCAFYLLLTGDAEKYTVVFDDRITGHLEFPNTALFNFIEDVLYHRISGNIPEMNDVLFVSRMLFQPR
jgi:hypothetical protein